MRGLGIAALITIGFSLLLWLLGWIFSIFIIPAAGYGSSAFRVLQSFNFLSSLLEYAAIILASIGLIMSKKK